MPPRSLLGLYPRAVRLRSARSISTATPSKHLPVGYTYYPNHNDIPMTPPPSTARIYESDVQPPHLPRTSLFHYLFLPKAKGRPPRYYDTPHPKTIAFIDGLTGRTLFRSDLPIHASWLRTGLKICGARKGDVACIFGENSLEWVSACFGAQATSMIVSPVDCQSTPSELLHQLKSSGASLIFIQPSLLPILDEALERGQPSYKLHPDRIILLCQPSEKPAETPYSCLEDLWRKAGRAKQIVSDEERRTAYLFYTSGTMGKRKAVELSQHNMTSQTQALCAISQPLRYTDAILGCLPFSNFHGLTSLLHLPLIVQATVIVLPKFDEISVLKAIERYRITMAYVVPPLITQLVNSTQFDKYDLSTLKAVQNAEAPLSIDMVNAFEARFADDPVDKGFGIEPGIVPRCRVIQSYGLTEASALTFAMSTAELEEHPGRVGKIVPSMQARLVGIESGADVDPGQPGELWLRGAGISKGYWKDEQATKDAFAEGGWFKTGDLAVIDQHGYFSIVDRVQDLIKYKEHQVIPSRLEAVLITHPLVVDAGVVGIYSESESTEVPRAYIVPRGGLTAVSPEDRDSFARTIASWADQKVADHRRLRGGVALINEIPRSYTGKVLRKYLRSRANREVRAEAQE